MEIFFFEKSRSWCRFLGFFAANIPNPALKKFVIGVKNTLYLKNGFFKGVKNSKILIMLYRKGPKSGFFDLEKSK